jgi:hypothetical protein
VRTDRRGKGYRKKRGAVRPLEYDSPKVDEAYFFFADFLAGFFAAAFFFAAIKLTTFHAVRDLTVAPTWQKNAGSLRPIETMFDVAGI